MAAGALERAVGILGVIGEPAGERSVAELAREAGMPTSTAYRLLAELERHDLVTRAADGSVALGVRLVALGRSAESALRERLVGPAAPIMDRLCERLGETVILTAPCALEALVLHVVEADAHPVRLSYALHRRGPMHRGASGKVLAAHLEPAARARLVAAAGEPGLAAELDRIRAAGWVMSAGELDPGAGALAAPILDRRGRLLAGLSVAGPAARVAALPELAGAVTEAARSIERAVQRAGS